MLNAISICNTGQRTAIVYIIRNATLGGTPVFNDINTNNSVMEFDTAGTTVTGGIQLAAIPIQAAFSQSLSLTNMNINIDSGQTITIGCRLATGGTNDVTASITWTEDR